jgi:NAD(P)H-hydrate epimerase
MTLRLYTGAETRELDRIAITEAGIAGFELMSRAADAAFAALLKEWPGVRSITVCCGKGNNAGDGYLVAGLAKRVGIDVELLQLGDPGELVGDAALARDWAQAQGIRIQREDIALPEPAGEIIVDALLGTGLSGPPREPFAGAIRRINAARKPVLAIDIPSGVSADTGAAAGPAVTATLTVTFIGRKLGLFTGAGAAASGRVVFADLGVGADITDRISGIPGLTFDDALREFPLPVRTPAAYKHALGHVLVIGGDSAMGGAPLMAGEAALRVGAGMVTVATRGRHRPAILARRPELMVVDADDDDDFDGALSRASTLIVGPGLGRTRWGANLLSRAVASSKPMVLDADGLNLLAQSGRKPEAPLIVTPHVAEAATLLDTSVADVQMDRPGAARSLAQLVENPGGEGVAVLKGAGSLIACARPGDQAVLLGICLHGNPGMASAGMGDVLSGVVGGLLAQGASPAAAAVVGVTAHSRAADIAAARTGERGLLATDLLEPLMRLLS